MRDKSVTELSAPPDFESLVKEYSGIINKVCYMYSGNRRDYEELRQDVMVNLWKGMGKFRGDSKISTWVYRVALNTCISFKKRNSWWNSRRASIESLREIADSFGGQSELTVKLHELLNGLKKLDKSLILLWLDDYSYDEIAEIAGMGRNAVATRLHRAKEKLRKMNEEEV